MASRRMRIKTVAKLPSATRPRPSDRPKTPIVEGDQDGEMQAILPSPGIQQSPKSSFSSDIASPPSIYNISSPSGSSYLPPPSPKAPVYHISHPVASPKTHQQQNEDTTAILHVMSISSAGLLSPRTPQSIPVSPSPASISRPESPRRPPTPKTPHSSHVDHHHETNSQDNFINPPTPTYLSAYSALSPGMGPGISLMSRAPPSVSPGPNTSCSSLLDESGGALSNKSAFVANTRHFSFNTPDSHSKSTVGKSKPNLMNRIKSNSSAVSSSTSQTQVAVITPHKDSSSTTPSTPAASSSETLRQRLQKGSIAPSNSKYAMIRKEYLNKYQNKTPDPKDLTILHYAFFNPPKPNLEEDSGGGEDPQNEDEDAIFEKEKSPERKKRKRSGEKVEDQPSSKEKEGETASKKSKESETVGPRVKVGPDGQLIVDEQSLVTITSEAERAKEKLAHMETVSGTISGFYRKKPFRRTTEWSQKDTIKFYRALMQCGTDFSMMASLFKNRTRSEIKAKFKREDRRNTEQVSRALRSQVFNPTLPLTDSEDSEEDEEKEQTVIEEEEIIKKEKGTKSRPRRKVLPEVDNLISDDPDAVITKRQKSPKKSSPNKEVKEVGKIKSPRDPTLPLTDNEDEEKEGIITKEKGTKSRIQRKILPEVDNLISDDVGAVLTKRHKVSKNLSVNKEVKEVGQIKNPRKPRRKSAAIAPPVTKFLPKNPKTGRVDWELFQSSLESPTKDPKDEGEEEEEDGETVTVVVLEDYVKPKSPKKPHQLKRTAMTGRLPGPGRMSTRSTSGQVEIEIEVECGR